MDMTSVATHELLSFFVAVHVQTDLQYIGNEGRCAPPHKDIPRLLRSKHGPLVV